VLTPSFVLMAGLSHQISVVSRYHVFLGTANRTYAWGASIKAHCTAMDLVVSSPTWQIGSWKAGPVDTLFSEPANDFSPTSLTLNNDYACI